MIPLLSTYRSQKGKSSVSSIFHLTYDEFNIIIKNHYVRSYENTESMLVISNVITRSQGKERDKGVYVEFDGVVKTISQIWFAKFAWFSN